MTQDHLEDLSEIRALMERSARFVSLSGLSGVCAGAFALVGAAVAYRYLSQAQALTYEAIWAAPELMLFLFTDALLVLLSSLTVATFFSARRAQKLGQPLWNMATRRLLAGLLVPLVAGGLFCLILAWRAPALLAAGTLVFYGLALINASKYTLSDVRYLGFGQIAVGLVAGVWPGYGLLYWAIGFGVLHIVYGAVMYWRYEHRQA